MVAYFFAPQVIFLSTLSLRRATDNAAGSATAAAISIHALLAESDRITGTKARNMAYFYPRSPCGERHAVLDSALAQLDISIHALLAESDRSGGPWQGVYTDFYPRSPCGERLLMWYQCNTVVKISIHALLAESDSGELRTMPRVYRISIHALLAESDLAVADLGKGYIRISIHALLAESDVRKNQVLLQYSRFLSTLSLRRATANGSRMPESPHC